MRPCSSRAPGRSSVLDDQIMVLVRRAIDQDVNLFAGARLQATSERDLFASGLLATRTPGEVYRRIVLDRLPTFVGEEEVGGVRYLLAAAPVRAGGREGIVTVPQTLRQQEIETADRRARPPRGLRLRALRAARRRHRLLDGGTDRRSGQPADARHAADRARRSRRAYRRHLVR